MIVVETARLTLRRMVVTDAPFIFELVNEPDWLRHIGDRGVRTIDAARDYIVNGPIDSYERHGFGLYLTELTESCEPIGICGLLKRESLEHVDLGFALVRRRFGRGYATEAAAAVVAYGERELGLERILAITSPDNYGSMRVLAKLGFVFERERSHSDDGSMVRQYAWARRESVPGAGGAGDGGPR